MIWLMPNIMYRTANIYIFTASTSCFDKSSFECRAGVCETYSSFFPNLAFSIMEKQLYQKLCIDPSIMLVSGKNKDSR